MKNTLLIIGMTLFSIFAVPQAIVFAADTLPTSATPANTTIRLDNPLVSTDPRIIAAHLISAMLGIIGSISLLMFVYGGVLWITSMGNDKTVAKGKAVLVYAVIGLAVIAGAYTLTNAVITGLTTGSVVPR